MKLTPSRLGALLPLFFSYCVASAAYSTSSATSICGTVYASTPCLASTTSSTKISTVTSIVSITSTANITITAPESTTSSTTTLTATVTETAVEPEVTSTSTVTSTVTTEDTTVTTSTSTTVYTTTTSLLTSTTITPPAYFEPIVDSLPGAKKRFRRDGKVCRKKTQSGISTLTVSDQYSTISSTYQTQVASTCSLSLPYGTSPSYPHQITCTITSCVTITQTSTVVTNATVTATASTTTETVSTTVSTTSTVQTIPATTTTTVTTETTSTSTTTSTATSISTSTSIETTFSSTSTSYLACASDNIATSYNGFGLVAQVVATTDDPELQGTNVQSYVLDTPIQCCELAQQSDTWLWAFSNTITAGSSKNCYIIEVQSCPIPRNPRTMTETSSGTVTSATYTASATVYYNHNTPTPSPPTFVGNGPCGVVANVVDLGS